MPGADEDPGAVGTAAGDASPEPEVVFYERDERIRRFGIDCGSELLWRNGTWQPGGEFCKTLNVKNVGNETIRLKYKPPKGSFFSMDFPEAKTLSPGMSMPVRVVFRPVRLEPYDDYVEFVIKNRKLKWTFFIPVRATLSRVAVDVPESVDFGFAPIAEDTVRHLEVHSIGTAPVEYRWQVNAPFSIEPSSGVITDKQVFEVHFKPRQASVFVSKALFHVKDLDRSPVLFKMSGIGKYPFVALSEERVDFEECFPGESAEREVVLRNQSVVPATFSIAREESDVLPVYSVEPTHGVVLPGDFVALRVAFTPRALGQFSCDHFLIKTPGGNTTRLECAGICVGPRISPGGAADESATKIQFGETAIAGPDAITNLAKFPTRVLRITNKTNANVRFQFFCDPTSEFQFEEAHGFVPGLLEKAITVRFIPRQAGNYFRRVFCVVQDQMPLYFDFVGTAFDHAQKGKRPQPLLFRHITAQRQRELLGLERETPERILELEADEEFTRRAALLELPENATTVVSSGCATFGQLEVCNQIFHRYTSAEDNVIVLSHEELDFGAGTRMSASAEKRVLHVTNRHFAKVTCTWTVNWADGQDLAPFAIFPASQDIGPGQTAEFRAVFRPRVDGVYYHATASAHVYLKSNRSFRLVNDAAFVPPFFVSVTLLGHTFPPDAEQFLPKANFIVHSYHAPGTSENSSKHSVEFPACHLGETVFSTAVLENAGDTPLKYDFTSDPGRRFEVFPRHGTVQPGAFQLFCFKSKPALVGEQRGRIECILNNSAENSHVFALSTFCSTPKLRLVEPKATAFDTESEHMYFRPTCVGLATTREFTVHNSSRVPLDFEWHIPKRLRAVCSVSPVSGRLRGNESAQLTWTFTPKTKRRYEIDAVLFASSIARRSEPSVSVQRRRVLKITGEGSSAFVTFETSELDMGTILSNGIVDKELTMTNHSAGDAHFRLSIRKQHESATLSMSEPEGVIPARSSKSIQVSFAPRSWGDYSFCVVCTCGFKPQVDATGCDASSNAPPELELECKVAGHSATPTLAVEDARAATASSDSLWRQFEIGRLNEILASPVTDAEMLFASLGGDATNPKAKTVEGSLDCVKFRFTPALHGSDTQSIALQLKNTSRLPANFRFRFPDESDIDVEPWADSQEPCEEELKQVYILDEHIFQIEPRTGQLEPGEAAVVRVSYKHSNLRFDGRHQLQVKLGIQNGKQIRILLEGRTLDPRKKEACAFPLERLSTFAPTRIGLTNAPAQEVRVLNPSSFDLFYDVDLQPIEQLREANYDFPVLRCLNPTGVLPAGQEYALRFVFTPLEATQYDCELSLRAQLASCGESAVFLIALRGRGFQDPADAMLPPLHGRRPPLQQLLPLRGQLASLSLDVLDFGRISQGTGVARMTIIRNQTAGPLAFAWDEFHPLITCRALRIEPMRGELAAGQFIACKLALVSGRVDEEFLQVDCDVRCVVEPCPDPSPPEVAIDRPSFSRTHRSESRASVRRPSVAILALQEQEELQSRDRSTLETGTAQQPPSQTENSRQSLHVHLHGALLHERDLNRREREVSFGVAEATTLLQSCLESTTISTSLGSRAEPSDLLENEMKCESEDSVFGAEGNFLRLLREALEHPTVHDSVAAAVREEDVPLFVDYLRPGKLRRGMATSEAQTRASALQTPSCQRLVHQVLDNTVFNLIQEAAHGEVDLTSHRTFLFPTDSTRSVAAASPTSHQTR